MHGGRIALLLLIGSLAGTGLADEVSAPAPSGQPTSGSAGLARFVATNCLDCHDAGTRQAGLALEELDATNVGLQAETWEKVARKLATRQMPPQEAPRPDEPSYEAAVSWLESSLDDAAARRPDPGRAESLRRLTRAEYQNAVRDLLGLEIDAEAWLPPDESSHGFDNITVTDLSPTLLGRYVSAAERISRLAVGRAPPEPEEHVYRIPADVTQDAHVAGLPLGTRGGAVVPYHFPQDGEYEVRVRLMRDRNDDVESLREPHDLEVMLDRERVELFTVRPPRPGESNQEIDANLTTRMTVTAGPHRVGVAFLKKPSSLLETNRQPLNVHFNFYRHPRIGPAVYQISIIGPLSVSGPGATPSRDRVFIRRPRDADDQEDCAQEILANLARRAFRRPVDDEDLRIPLEFHRQGFAEEGFEAGIELALSALLVNPRFLFRVERDPDGASSGEVHPVTDIELASRLSFFLWSSIPDDELLGLAERGELRQPEVLRRQVRRMLADRRSRSLFENFAGQWLHLRNLDSVVPDMRLYPDFDDNLRQALRRETELFFESIVGEDRSVLDLIRADYTFLNERLARHYGISHVHGSRFRRVTLDEQSRRGGLLRQGSILAVTSYATRTSPVIRGQWVLTNLLGTPSPPPPPDIPDLEDNTVLTSLSVRERLQQHRDNPACASCHNVMDPVGFALENFDAVGRWRETDAGQPLDVSGGLPDGSEFSGVAGLEDALLARPELFARTLTEKLLTFALGRGVEYHDAPAVRKIVRDARDDDYRFSRLILGIVESTPFQMRRSP